MCRMADSSRLTFRFDLDETSCIPSQPDTPHTEWHRAYTSVPRSEMILAAAKTIATLYKQATLDYNQLVAAQAEAAAAGGGGASEASTVPSGGGMPEPAE
ncbi:hypothetical protein ZHAS_00017723 [Anopheles sinensis]|uniref:Uncharacterized protein n=1 Tax=Anopheles sinensis TaxID=74873 RepID=A0A084WH25_ANOSI|nr:hypothetical protein ZHAS_00017723 [Anopheles sinensis]